ncbi:MAG: MAPEG family protein [Erythrobacter sp.]
MIILPVTLASAAAAAILNIWLSIRIGAIRRAAGIFTGDGGSEPLQRRMRAQLNFVENTAFVLILIIAIELSGAGKPWLPSIAALYFIARVAHGFGMDGGKLAVGRMVGTVVTLLTQLGLAVVAVLIVTGVL